MSRFNQVTAEECSAATYPPPADSGTCPPRVFFALDSPHRMIAKPPGALIRCDLHRFDQSLVTIRTTEREHIAEVMVIVPPSEDATKETIAIASALYWSWWRARDMHGEAPSEDPHA